MTYSGQSDYSDQLAFKKLNEEYTRTKEENTKLKGLLNQSFEQLKDAKEKCKKLSEPPCSYGVIVKQHDDETVDVRVNNSKYRVNISPDIEHSELHVGQEVIVNGTMAIVGLSDVEDIGGTYTLKEILSGGNRVLVSDGNNDSDMVVILADWLRGSDVKSGDSLVVGKSHVATEVIPKSDVEELLLEKVPDISYEDIGGLSSQIETIRDAVELPFLHRDLFEQHMLKPPKGVLLYGPPGCGKTLIAKAVANSLAKQAFEKSGGDGTAYFINIKGPELLDKFVGESERHIRNVFEKARRKASDGTPVIIFFDEMEALFRTRGSGVSSDIENTIVPQLLTEIDGVEGMENVIVVGASNREDMIDPAVLRPGRLDAKIKVQRPDKDAAQDIFGKYLVDGVPIHDSELTRFEGNVEKTILAMISDTVDYMYAETDQNKFLEVTYVSGDKETLYFKDFNSGAMIQGIVDRAKKTAIKQLLDCQELGLKTQYLIDACVDEFRENEDLPNTTNPDDWARISGKKGERIAHIRTLVADSFQSIQAPKHIETVSEEGLGQYL